MSTETEAQSIIDAARMGADPRTLALGEYHIVPTANGDVRTFDLTGDQYRDQPRRKTGTVVVRDVPSFLAYYSKHASPVAEVFANRDRNTVTGILDAHTGYGGTPEWQMHRVVLELRYSEAFKAWTQASGQLMPQSAFAELIEDHRTDIREPDAAAVLEMAQTFHATTKVAFKSSTMLKSGQRQLSYVESIDASSGQRGEMAVPDHLQLAVPVYEGATVADPIVARLRFRIDDGRLKLGIILDRLSDVVQAAFEGVIAEIDAGISEPVLRGIPA
jgi:uncharacterized protein YfdQ (DUF2303 family)